ncbi:ROK family protein [Leifsonia sp. Leaf264]|uniref:ROK family protein n=1 Tax=Leifsonia sp. Leaf264 TaxID=1736314 RepID=UPI0006FDF52D|nr:ROK family protein [Leifsonia sp. Leaf264]KQO97751.1 hypothetical protein ASF30_15295 [Leifsonia sp. Leaf264]
MNHPRGKVKRVLESVAATSPTMLRRRNADVVLRFAWSEQAFTASDLIAHTGLTRSTVIGVCDELVDRGWLAELDDARSVGEYSKGRPARRYALRADAASVVGVDAGRHSVTASAADLRGTVLGTASRAITDDADGEERRAVVRAVIDDAVAAAGLADVGVRAICVGVPAPTDATGASPRGTDGFWSLSNPDFVGLLADERRLALVDNDANLAAIAEGAERLGEGRGVESFITLLSGERIGGGIVVDGHLLRGVRGGAGEMRVLDYVDGVGSADGAAALIREWSREAVATGSVPATSVLRHAGLPEFDAQDVLDAAGAGDAAAAAVTQRLAERFARICVVLGELLDVQRVVIAGAMAEPLEAVLAAARVSIAGYDDPTAPELVGSRLGGGVVSLGAVRRALDAVRESALDLELASLAGDRATSTPERSPASL